MAKQLRGEPLKEAIRKGIRFLFNRNDDYIYNATELAKLVGTSRVTLNKLDDVIEEELNKLNIERKTSSGSLIIDNLLEKIQRLKEDKEALKNELDILRRNHIEIYERLYSNSYDMSQLIKPIIRSESLKSICGLCGSQLDCPTNESNIIDFRDEN